MAVFSCLHHRSEHPHYLTYYAQPLAYRRCSEDGCTGQIIVWLNPEEVNDYRRGCRRFFDDEFSTLGVDDSGLSCVPDPAPPPRLDPRALKAFRPFGYLKRKAI